MINDKTFDCGGCRYLNGKRCMLWQVKVNNPVDAHCESWQKKQEDKNEMS